MHTSNVASRSDEEVIRPGRSGPARWVAIPAALGVALALVIGACTNPLEVQNPNKLTDEDVSQPSAMPSLANGAEGAVTRGIQAIGAPYQTATDEITWIGSRDAWNQLDQGKVEDPVNEFTDAAFPFVAEGRFMADRAISEGERFRSEGALTNPTLLAKSYLFGALIYTTIAEQFDDFVLPDDPQEAVPPVGEGNMDQLFDTAIGYATSGLDIAESGSDLAAQLLAIRARAKHSKAIWAKLNPPGSTPADPLVDAGRADAQQVLDMAATGSDWKFRLNLRSELLGLGGAIAFAFQVNERGELQIGSDYVATDPDDPSQVTAVTIQDPIDGVVDPVIEEKLFDEENGFLTQGQFAPMTMASAREMHLIIAESELARNGDNSVFRSHINAVRGLDGLSEYDGSTVTAMEILRHERRVNLFLMFRRLTDMYRFGVVDSKWQSTSTAFREPGSMLPITITEILANPQVDG